MNESQVDRYLAEAEAAERLAQSCPDGFLRNVWRDIALGYRELANAALAQSITGELPEQPLPWPVRNSCDQDRDSAR